MYRLLCWRKGCVCVMDFFPGLCCNSQELRWLAQPQILSGGNFLGMGRFLLQKVWKWVVAELDPEEKMWLHPSWLKESLSFGNQLFRNKIWAKLRKNFEQGWMRKIEDLCQIQVEKKKFFLLTQRKLPGRMCTCAHICGLWMEEFDNQPFPK